MGGGGVDAASFAERRLAVARLSSRWVDWAMATLARPPFADEQDSEARLIRAMVRGGLGIESLRRVGPTVKLGTANSEGARGAGALWHELATLGPPPHP